MVLCMCVHFLTLMQASTKWTKYNDETDKHLEGHVFAPVITYLLR